jgi:hypothetical protein
MGHTSDKMTLQRYTDPSAVVGARELRVLTVLEGGKKNGTGTRDWRQCRSVGGRDVLRASRIFV